MNFQLQIDDKAKTIQGVEIPADRFDKLKFTVINNYMSGWKPSKRDIEYLIYNISRPGSEYNEKYKEQFSTEQN